MLNDKTLTNAKREFFFRQPSWASSIRSVSVTYFAAAAVLARVAVALVGLDLAVLAGEPGPAGAGVAALAGVGARSAVLARLVVGAVVQVWSLENRRSVPARLGYGFIKISI